MCPLVVLPEEVGIEGLDGMREGGIELGGLEFGGCRGGEFFGRGWCFGDGGHAGEKRGGGDWEKRRLDAPEGAFGLAGGEELEGVVEGVVLGGEELVHGDLRAGCSSEACEVEFEVLSRG